MPDNETKNIDLVLEQQFKHLFNNMLQGATLAKFIVDSKGKPINYSILAVNDACEKIIGIKREQAVGRKISEVIPGILEDPSDWVGKLSKVAFTGQSEEMDAYLEPLNKYYHVSVFSPKKCYFITVFFDITERKKVDAQLKQRTEQLAMERERFLRMMENLPVMVALLTEDYHVAFANRLFKEKFGELSGQHCYEYCFGQTKPCSFCETFQPLQTGKAHHWTVATRDGSLIDVYDYPFTDVDGSPMILEVDIDITARKKLEKQLQDKERMAAIGQTTGMVGHDIRNPLQAMTSEIYLLRNDLSCMAQCTNCLTKEKCVLVEHKQGILEGFQSLEDNIDYINKIVADLQDYARPLSPEFVTVTNVCKVIRDYINQFNIPRNIAVSQSCDVKAPIPLDLIFLKRILMNLISNAVQAMPNGGKLKIYAYEKDSKLLIAVEDTGPGIPDEIKPTLFEPMTTTKAKGQGLGLAVVKRLVEAQSGAVTFESDNGKGARFIVELPL